MDIVTPNIIHCPTSIWGLIINSNALGFGITVLVI